MSEEQRQILEMLSEGKINADEADRLLRVINQPQSVNVETPTGSQQHHEHERVAVMVHPDADAEHSDTRDDVLTVGESPRLVVNVENGRIAVEADDDNDNEIHVEARLKNASRVDYRVTQDGDTVRVEARKKGKASLFGFLSMNTSVEITVTTPRNTNVELTSSNGRIELTEVENSGTLQTSNGRIIMESIKGDFEATTSNSKIELHNAEGSATLRTSNGQIVMEGVKGDFDAQTSNGSISFSGEMAPGGDNQMKTSNGKVRVNLQGTPSLKIDATTSNGSITTELSNMAASIEEKNRLVGTIGDGEAQLVIQTSNGSVSIE